MQTTIEIPNTASTGRWPVFLASMALAALGVIAYANCYFGAMVFDDLLCLVERDAIHRWWPRGDELFTVGLRRWFAHLTFVANYKVHGFDVVGYHAVNVLIHVSAGLLLFGLVRRTLLLPPQNERYAARGTALALAVAALWLVHPLQTESVTYIIQRLESLAGMFFLLTLYALSRTATARRAWPWQLVAAVAVTLGMGCKEVVFVAPLAALLYDRAYLSQSWREALRRRWLMYMGMLPGFLWLSWYIGRTLLNKRPAIGFHIPGVSAWEYLRSQPAVILHYLKLTFWPTEQTLDYGWPVETDPWRIFGFGAAIVALVVASLVLWWKRPRIGFVTLMFFFTLAPTSSIVPIRDLAFEHRMYLPLAAVAVLVVLAVDDVCRRRLRGAVTQYAIPATLLTLVVAGLTWKTLDRNRVYADPVFVWMEAVQQNPRHLRAWYNLGQLLVNRGVTGSVPHAYQRMLRDNPEGILEQGKGQGSLVIAGDFRLAIYCFEQTLALNPRDDSAQFNIGGLYDRAGRADEAIVHYEGALAINPRHLHARMNLARLLGERGDVEDARRHFLLAKKHAPSDPRPLVNYGKMLAQLGDHQAASAEFRAAAERFPQNTSSRSQLALCLWVLGDQRGAIQVLREARAIHASLADVNLTLARYLAETDEKDLFDPATGAILARTVREKPGKYQAQAWEVEAMCLAALGRLGEAIAAAKEAERLALAGGAAADLERLPELQARIETWQETLTGTKAVD